MQILRAGGVAPLALLTGAALVTGTISNGIGLLGPEIQKSFRLSDAGLGAVTFVAAVAQIGWGLPVARHLRPRQPQADGVGDHARLRRARAR